MKFLQLLNDTKNTILNIDEGPGLREVSEIIHIPTALWRQNQEINTSF